MLWLCRHSDSTYSIWCLPQHASTCTPVNLWSGTRACGHEGPARGWDCSCVWYVASNVVCSLHSPLTHTHIVFLHIGFIIFRSCGASVLLYLVLGLQGWPTTHACELRRHFQHQTMARWPNSIDSSYWNTRAGHAESVYNFLSTLSR
jgi:hypothetical protein